MNKAVVSRPHAASVPASSGWHWAAIQSDADAAVLIESVAVASDQARLMNPSARRAGACGEALASWHEDPAIRLEMFEERVACGGMAVFRDSRLSSPGRNHDMSIRRLGGASSVGRVMAVART